MGEIALSLSVEQWVAWAMGCKLVYGIVPESGRTLEELAERRLWESVLGHNGRRRREPSFGGRLDAERCGMRGLSIPGPGNRTWGTHIH
jgi:hypothetical protein